MVALGGLHILATERHEARRIDNQLRGRAGRQGDPGSSRFYLSLEDDLMRIFGSDRISGLMLKLGMEEGVPIEHGMVTKSIERAQKQVEAQNFAVRKHLLEYDDVMNKQRKAVYDMRRMILEGKDTRELRPEPGRGGPRLVPRQLRRARSEDPDKWNLEGLQLAPQGDLRPRRARRRAPGAWAAARWRRPSPSASGARTRRRSGRSARRLMLFHERMIMLQIVDTQWKDHLYALDHLKEGIGLRGYGQRDPARRVQERVVQHVPGPHGPHRRGDPALDLPVPAGARRPETRRGAAADGPRRAAAPPAGGGRGARRRAAPRARARAARWPARGRCRGT